MVARLKSFVSSISRTGMYGSCTKAPPKSQLAPVDAGYLETRESHTVKDRVFSFHTSYMLQTQLTQIAQIRI